MTDEDIPAGERAGLIAFRERVRGTNISEKTLLATDYLNHFNEIVMLLEMLPDMPEMIGDAREWQPKSYQDHFRDSAFSDRDLAIEAYGHVPSTFRHAFEATIGQLDRLLLDALARLEAAIAAGTDADSLRAEVATVTRAAQALMDVASANIHGSDRTMDQTAIDSLLGR